MLSLHKIKIKKEKPDYKTSNTQEDEKYNNPLVHIYFFFYLLQNVFPHLLTVCKPALFQYFTESLTELQVALVLCTLNELFELIGANLLLLLLFLLVERLWLLLMLLLTNRMKD